MKQNEKLEALKAKAVGYWSGLDGLELKEIEYDIEDYAIVVSGAWCSQKKVHRVKIHYETEVPYIVVNGSRWKFDECIRTEAF